MIWPKTRGCDTDPLSDSDRSLFFEKLISGYKELYAEVTSLVDEHKRDVSTMTFNLMETDKREAPNSRTDKDFGNSICQGLKRPDERMRIELKDLFPADEDHVKVMITGMPGVGKSTLGKRLALDWAKGTWGSQFRAMFFLSVASLIEESNRTDKQNENILVSVISKDCFKLVDKELSLEDVQKIVRKELKNPNTLVILDEAEKVKNDVHGIVDAVVDPMNEERNKLLMFARPCVKKLEDEMDKVFELCPLSKVDVLHRLSTFPAIRSQVIACPCMTELARNPLHLEILLSTGQSDDANITHHPRNTAAFVSEIAVMLWQIYEPQNGSTPESRDKAFKDLGKLAIRGLVLEEHRIPVNDKTVDVGYISKCNLDDRGLLLHHQNGDVEFTHSILLQYFAGRHLAKWLGKGEMDEEKAREHIQQIRYDVGEVLSVAAMEIGRKRHTEGMQKLLSTIDSGEVELIGLQHLRVKMRCLQHWLLEYPPSVDDYQVFDKKFEISGGLALIHLAVNCLCVDRLKKWLEQGIEETCQEDEVMNDVVMKEVVSLLRDFPCVVRRSKACLLKSILKKVGDRDWDVHEVIIEALAWIINVNDDDDDEPWISPIQQRLRQSDDDLSRIVMKHMVVIGEISNRCIPQLLEALFKEHSGQLERNDVRDRTVIALLRESPKCAYEYIQSLVDVCKNEDYWVRKAIMKAMPRILDGNQPLADQFVTTLLPDSKTNQALLPSGVIGVLVSCVQVSPSKADRISRHLLATWEMMDEDQMAIAAQVFIETIRVKPDMAFGIFENLFRKQNGCQSRCACRMLKEILGVLKDIPHDAKAVLEHIKGKCITNEDNAFSLVLMLEAVKNVVHVSEEHLPLLKTLIGDAFGHKEWRVREQAYLTVGAFSRYQPQQLSDDLVKGLVRGCKGEEVWKAKVGALEAAADLTGSGSEYSELIEVCVAALEDPDDVIRKLAGRVVMNAISSNMGGEETLLNDLVDKYKALSEESSDSAKHGVVHCLDLVAQEHPETISVILPILEEAAGSQSPLLLSTAVSGILTVAASGHADVKKLIDVLYKAHKQEQRRIRFCILDALTTCIHKKCDEVKLLIESLKDLPRPQNNDEWMVYLHALEVVLMDPRKDANQYLKALAKDNKDDNICVRQKRKEILGRISFSQLFKLDRTTNSPLVVHHICRKLYNTPGVLINNSESQEHKKWIIRCDKEQHKVSNQLYKKLMKCISRESTTSGNGNRHLRTTISLSVPVAGLIIMKMLRA